MAEAKTPRRLKPLPIPPANQAAQVTYAVALAFRALRDGSADSTQQKLALEWLVGDACGKRHFPYHANDRDTVFALGRLFVAEQVVGLLNVDLGTLRSRDLDAET